MRQAEGSLRPRSGVEAARLVLGSLDEETGFLEFDVDRDADIALRLGYDWLRAHGLAFRYDSTGRARPAAAGTAGSTQPMLGHFSLV